MFHVSYLEKEGRLRAGGEASYSFVQVSEGGWWGRSADPGV